MARQYIDFDAAIAEAEEEPVVVRFRGRDWTLFSSVPAKPVLGMLRLRAEGRGEDELSTAEMVSYMAQFVPADVLEQWLDLNMTLVELTGLLRLILTTYGGEKDAEGEAQSPSAGPQPSSSTSQP